MAVKEDVIEVKDGRFIMDVAIATEPPLSKSQKSRVYFTTSGNKRLEGDFVVGVNLYKKVE